MVRDTHCGALLQRNFLAAACALVPPIDRICYSLYGRLSRSKCIGSSSKRRRAKTCVRTM